MKRGTEHHRKMLAFQEAAGLRRYEAVGVLEIVWSYAQQHSITGDLGPLTDSTFAGLIGATPDDGGRILRALVDAGWLDLAHGERVCIHDWSDHAPTWVHRQLFSRQQRFWDGRPPSRAELNSQQRRRWDTVYGAPPTTGRTIPDSSRRTDRDSSHRTRRESSCRTNRGHEPEQEPPEDARFVPKDDSRFVQRGSPAQPSLTQRDDSSLRSSSSERTHRESSSTIRREDDDGQGGEGIVVRGGGRRTTDDVQPTGGEGLRQAGETPAPPPAAGGTPVPPDQPTAGLGRDAGVGRDAAVGELARILDRMGGRDRTGVAQVASFAVIRIDEGEPLVIRGERVSGSRFVAAALREAVASGASFDTPAGLRSWLAQVEARCRAEACWPGESRRSHHAGGGAGGAGAGDEAGNPFAGLAERMRQAGGTPAPPDESGGAS